MNDIDLAYAAGIFDGEGCVSIVKNKDNRCKRGYSYRLVAIHHKKKGHFTMVELYYSQTFGEPRLDENENTIVGAMK